MPDQISFFATLLGASVLYAVVCASLAKAGLSKTHDAPWTKTAGVLFACFSLLVAFCTMLHPSSAAASACASIAICACSIAAAGFLLHRWRRQEALETIRTNRIGKLVDEHRALKREKAALPAVCAKAAREYDLTRREEAVLACILQGKTQTDISHELVLSVNTVKSHVRNIYRKIGVHSKQELSDTLLNEAGGRGESF